MINVGHFYWIFQIICLSVHANAVTICPTAVWDLNFSTVAGSPLGTGGSTSALLIWPNNIFVDSNGAMFVSDRGNNRIQQILPNASTGITVAGGSAGSGLHQFNYVAGVGVDGAGNIYVSDMTNARVMKWASGASAGTVVAGGNGAWYGNNSLDYPYGLFVEPSGSHIWIADQNNHRVVRWSIPGAAVVVYGRGLGSAADQFSGPTGVFVDTANSNTIYVADSGNHRIQKWLPNASAGITVAGQTGVSGTALNELNYPVAVIVDSSGNMFISEANNYRISRWAAEATSGVPIAGNMLINGVWLSRWTDYLSGIAIDPSSSLLCVDNFNHRVRKFAVNCVTTTTSTTSVTPTTSTTTSTTSRTTSTTSATTSSTSTTTSTTSRTTSTTSTTTSSTSTTTSTTSRTTSTTSTTTSTTSSSSLGMNTTTGTTPMSTNTTRSMSPTQYKQEIHFVPVSILIATRLCAYLW